MEHLLTGLPGGPENGTRSLLIVTLMKYDLVIRSDKFLTEFSLIIFILLTFASLIGKNLFDSCVKRFFSLIRSGESFILKKGILRFFTFRLK